MKQVILIRNDVEMSTGKAIAQGAHASVSAVQSVDESTAENWLTNYAGTKITLGVSSEEQLRAYIAAAEDRNLPTNIVTDLGRTEIESGTTTAGAIGPGEVNTIDEITGDLPLYK